MGTRTGLERCGKSRAIWIRLPDRAARSQSLYILIFKVLMLYFEMGQAVVKLVEALSYNQKGAV